MTNNRRPWELGDSFHLQIRSQLALIEVEHCSNLSRRWVQVDVELGGARGEPELEESEGCSPVFTSRKLISKLGTGKRTKIFRWWKSSVNVFKKSFLVYQMLLKLQTHCTTSVQSECKKIGWRHTPSLRGYLNVDALKFLGGRTSLKVRRR